MHSLKQSADVSYRSISSGQFEDEEQPLRPQQQFELSEHPQLVRNRRWFVTVLVQILSALWLAPILYLLYLNLSGHIIGASAWCPGGDCYLDPWNNKASVIQNDLVRYNKNDHNLLGGLQLVAKALEIWFIAVCAAFVYLMIMHYASKPEGLPIGYLTRPTEFAEFINLFDPLLWTTGPSPFAKDPRDKRVGRRAWSLIILSVVLCLLCNLMGPAVAVLAIPSLSWIGTEHIGSLRFVETNAGAPPSLDSWFHTTGAYLCYDSDITSRNYSCALETSGSSLDSWLDMFLSSRGMEVYTTAMDLTFYMNVTAQRPSSDSKKEGVEKDWVTWVPSRQMLWNISNDIWVMRELSKGKNFSYIREHGFANDDPLDSYVEYNRSVQMQIERTGPVTGFIPHWWYGYSDQNTVYLPWTINVDPNRQIRCYSGYCKDTSCYTKCIRIGRGWGKLNKEASFFVPQVFDSESEVSKKAQSNTLGVQVNIYSSDRVLYLPDECDWDRLFVGTKPPEEMIDLAENMNTIEMYIADGKGHESILVQDFVAYTNWATYSYDPSPLTNPTSLVRMDGLPSGSDPVMRSKNIHIDPDWILAGWAVGNGENIQTGRASGTFLLRVMYSFFYDGYDATMELTQDYNQLDLPSLIAFVPVAHSLSLIDHKTELVTAASQPDEDHPLLYRTARMYVWGYFMASRTAILGVAVTSAGCIIVLAQLYLGIKDRRRYRSPTQLLVAALEHKPQGEFEGKRHDEKAMARVPFHVSECDKKVIRFSSLSSQGGISPSSPNHTRVFSGPTRHSRMSSGATLFSPTQNIFSPGRKVSSPPQGAFSADPDGYFPIAPDSFAPVAADMSPPMTAGFTRVPNFSYPPATGTGAATRMPSNGAAPAPGSFTRVPVGGRSPSVSGGTIRTHTARSPSSSGGAGAPQVPPIPGFSPWQGDGPGFQVHPTYTRTFI